jgi:hypothetical protein
MHDYFSRNWDYLLSLGNTSFTLAMLSAIEWDKVLTILFITIPVGVWSWFRLIDFLKDRYAREHAPSPNRPEAL